MSHFDIVLSFAELEEARKGRLLARMRLLREEAESWRDAYYERWEADHSTDLSPILSCMNLFDQNTDSMNSDDREKLLQKIEEDLAAAKHKVLNNAEDDTSQESHIVSGGAQDTPDFASAYDTRTSEELKRRWEKLCGDYYMLSGEEYCAEAEKAGAGENDRHTSRRPERLTEERVRRAEKEIGKLRQKELKRRFEAALTEAGLPVYGSGAAETDTIRMNPGVEELVVRGRFGENGSSKDAEAIQKVELQLMRTGAQAGHSREELQRTVGSFCSRSFAEKMAAALEKQGLKVEKICGGESRENPSQRGQVVSTEKAPESASKTTHIC